ncbi:hypothetical protein HBI77_028360 [Parastagonospora nodorum]|nr:hypothetical protein HBI77_028360 [Parastagonospora nodorum]
MIAEFITKTAALIREKKVPCLDATEEVIAEKFCIRPNQTYLNPSWVWGPKVENLKYDKKTYFRVEDLSIIISAYNSEDKAGATIRIKNIIPDVHLTNRPKFEDTTLEHLLVKVFKL